MSKPNDFRFFIYSVISGVDTYYVLSGGSVITTTTKDGAELEYAPEEWADVEMSWERSQSLHGIFTKLSNEYKFVGDGATILRHIIFTQGYDAKAKLLVEVIDNSAYLYNIFSVNDIAFNKPPVDLTSVTVSLFDNGIANDFKSNLDTPYEIPLEGDDVIIVEHEGTTVKAKFNYRYGDVSISNARLRTNPAEWNNLLLTPTTSEGLRPVATEHTANSIIMGLFEGVDFYGRTDDFSDQYDRYILQSYQTITDVTVDYKVKFDWRFVPSGAATTATDAFLAVNVVISKDRDFFTAKPRLYTGAVYPTTTGAWNSEVINVSAFGLPDLNKDDRVYIVVGVFGNCAIAPTAAAWGFEIKVIDSVDSRVAINMAFNSTKSDIQGFRLHKLMEKTVEKFADGKYGATPFSSIFLSDPASFYKGAVPYRTIITNGNAIKGIVDSIFKLSMKDLIEDIQYNYSMGIGVESGQLIAERLPNFYRDDVTIVDLGELTNWSITPLNKIPTVLIVGNKYDNDNDILNGSFDANTKTAFKSQNISESESKIEYVSPVVSSIYDIERMRVSEAGKDTTGNKVNDSLYKLSVVETAVGDKYKINYEGAGGGGFYIAYNTLGDNPYNVEFTPQNMRIRLNEILYSNAYPSTTDITFQKSDRYSGMASQYYDFATSSYTSLLFEDGNITPDGTELLWLPFIAKFQSIVPIDFDALMAINPYGKVVGTVNGKEIHGYILSAKMKPSNRNIFDWEVLLTPSTDINDLIF